MAMERLRNRFSADPTYLFDESTMNVGGAKESNPTGREGHIPTYPVGTTFETRAACCKAGVHGRTVAGIHGSKSTGAYSICMSRGYEDDTDEGDFIVYTGTGGQDDSFGGRTQQVHDQSFAHPDNAALAKNCETQRPVRVIRGPNPKSQYAPAFGYRYDGLYRVTRYYLDKGKSGLLVCRYELQRLPGQPPLPVAPNSPSR